MPALRATARLDGGAVIFYLMVDNLRGAVIVSHMVEYGPDALDSVFRALADPTRRAMIERLAPGERTVGELAEPFAMSLAGASKHLRVLEDAGLIERRVAGRTHYCRLRAARLAWAHQWLSHYQRFWSAQLDALEALLAAEDAGAPPPTLAATSASAPTARRVRTSRRRHARPHHKGARR